MLQTNSLGGRLTWILLIGALSACQEEGRTEPQLPPGNDHAGHAGIDQSVTAGTSSAGSSAGTAGQGGGAGSSGGAQNLGGLAGEGGTAGSAGAAGTAGAGGSGGAEPEPVRPRWLVYSSNESGVNALRAVDIGSEVRSSVAISHDPDVNLAVAIYGFSRDGKYLAYVADNRLYVADMSVPAPGRSVVVKTPGVVRYMAWSPDSKTIAFVGRDEDGKYKVFYTDATAAAPETLGAIYTTNPSASLRWLGASTLIVRGGPSSWSFARRTENGFGAFEPLGGGDSGIGYPELDSVALINSPQGGACGGSWNVINLTTKQKALFGGSTALAANLKFAATWNASRLGYILVPLADRTDERVLSIKPESFFCNGTWSHKGTVFAWTNDVDRVAIMDAEWPKERAHNVVDGAYTTVGRINTALIFSPDDRWLIFTGTFGELFITKIESATPAIAQRVTPDLASDKDAVNRTLFSPDSRYLAYAAPQDATGKQEVFVVDLTGDAASEPRKVSLTNTNSAVEITNMNWSADSSTLVFTTVSTLTSEGKKTSDVLYAVKIREAQATAQSVNSPVLCDLDAAKCSRVQSLQLQP